MSVLCSAVLSGNNVYNILVKITDRKAGDPSDAGADQTDGKRRDSKDRWVAAQYSQGETVLMSLSLVSLFSLPESLHMFLSSIRALLLYSLSFSYSDFIGFNQSSPLQREL